MANIDEIIAKSMDIMNHPTYNMNQNNFVQSHQQTSQIVNEFDVSTDKTNQILESFRKMPPMSEAIGEVKTPPESFQQSIKKQNVNDYEQQARHIYNQQKQVNEQLQQQYQQQQPIFQQQIDYNYIKHLIKECLNENNKEQLVESSLAGLRICKGNKIQFVDSKGNLFEGVLKLVKKA